MTAAKEIRTGRPPGRPRKFAEGRVHATVRLTPQLYADIKEKADAARRSISEEVEARLERLAAQDSAMAAMGTSLEKIKEGNLEAELWRSGYTPIRTSQGKLWAPPGYPDIERSGFKPWDEGEVEQSAAAREAAGISDEEIEAETCPRWSSTDRLSEIEESATEPKKDKTTRPMTAEETERALREIEEIKQRLEGAREKQRVADAKVA
jgi:hypothetical protein